MRRPIEYRGTGRRACTLRRLLLLGLFLVLCPDSQAREVTILAVAEAELRYPTDLALDADDEAWVVDGLNARVVEFDKRGRFRRELRHPAFQNLVGIDIAGGAVYLTDTGSASIHVLSPEGELRKSIALPAGCDPVDVLVLPDRLVVSDNDNHRLLLLSAEGGLQGVIGKGARGLSDSEVRPLPAGQPGEAVAEFIYPGILSRHGSGFLAVDVLGGRVQAFTQLANFDRMVGNFGEAPDRLFRPQGACACWTGMGVLVTDGYTGLIHLYSEYSEHQGVLERGGRPWALRGPTAITGRNGAWWIVEGRTGRIIKVGIDTKGTDR